jgi:glyceraldehyde 3-phosphate dehydrogenase
MAIRAPVADGSVTDLVCVLGRDVTIDEINEVFKRASGEDGWSGILEYTEDPIVSSDIVGNSHSCIIDAQSTMANGSMVKVIGWYDNEWGYSCRLADLVERMAATLTAEPVGAQTESA